MSDSGDFGACRPPGPAPGCGVPPLEAVDKSCGLPTLLSAYLMFCAPTLVCVRGAIRLVCPCDGCCGALPPRREADPVGGWTISGVRLPPPGNPPNWEEEEVGGEVA